MACNRSFPRLAVLAVFTAAILQAVTVTGPIASTTPLRDPAHGYPYNSTPIDLAKQGCMEEEFEEEFFIEGAANAHNTPAGQTGGSAFQYRLGQGRQTVNGPHRW
jgi:hypothetical protein